MKQIIKPQTLLPGDTIAVVAPASNVKRESLEAGVAELKRRGFNAKYREDIFALERYTAGSVRRRVDELHGYFADPEVKAIIAARGGFGSIQLLEHLDWDVIASNPKIFCGYSDISTLSIALYQKCSLVTFHGPMVAKDFATENYDWRSFMKALTRPIPVGQYEPGNVEVLCEGRARGRLLGGCLPMVTSLIGTDWELDTDNCILFLEDTAAKPYQIERNLQQLRLAGKLDKVRGIIFGEMTDCIQHPRQGYRLQEMLKDVTSDLGIPVLFGLRSGHSDKNMTIPLGVEASLDCQRGLLAVEESAVI
ncbi:MAG: LD-carboxypeptidase [Acidobacteriota bacterium]|nr:LD-carboxypeptidase [Blastocatellia bacterium]MDW8411531.1 LD-carboxypeptidase [Acidobacteriota bacterium]